MEGEPQEQSGAQQVPHEGNEGIQDQSYGFDPLGPKSPNPEFDQWLEDYQRTEERRIKEEHARNNLGRLSYRRRSRWLR